VANVVPDDQFYLRSTSGELWVLRVDAVTNASTAEFAVTLVSTTGTAPRKNETVQVSLVHTTQSSLANYYTRAQIDALLALKADASHTHVTNVPTMTVTSQVFQPEVGLYPGSTATIEWVSGGVVVGTGLAPTINFGSAGTRQVTMVASEPSEVEWLNLGYDNTQDSGRYMIGSGFDKAAEAVTAITGLQELPNLRIFAAANGPLTGHLNVSGLALLEYLECYDSEVQTVDLTGCDSMIRVCLERNRLSYIDLNPVAATLRDFRCADNLSGALTLEPLTAPLASCYHFCIRDQTITNWPTYEQTPVLEEIYYYRTNLSGTYVVPPVGNVGRLYTNPLLTGIDASNYAGTGNGILWAYDCALTSVVLSSTPYPSIRLYNNNLDQSDIDGILAAVEAWGTSNGELNLSGNTAPSAAGDADVALLEARGWTVTVDTGGAGGNVIWEDNFDRADATGIANVGNGWTLMEGTQDANILSGDLERTGVPDYCVLGNAAGGLIPADNFEIEYVGPRGTFGQYFGIAYNVDVPGLTGYKMFFRDPETDARRAGSLIGLDGTDFTVSLPAGWTDPGDHTLTLRVEGTTLTVLMDGTVAWSGTGDAGIAGRGLAIVGEAVDRSNGDANRIVRSVTVREVV
jgi:hypothetical protein